MSEKICGNCWQWKEPDYEANPGKCEMNFYHNPYKDSKACDDFDDRYPEEE